MSDEENRALGELLRLMTEAHRSFRTLRGDLRSWTHATRQHEAYRRQYGDDASSEVAIALTDASCEPAPAETEDIVQLWLARPDRLREELTSSYGGTVFEATLVQVGETWWSYVPGTGAQTNDGDPNSVHGTRLRSAMIDPAELLPWRRLEILGRVVHAGRPAIRVASRPSPRDAFLPDAGRTAGDWPEEYLVDAERGVLLSLTTFIDGEPFALCEFVSVAFDEEIADDVFVFAPPAGVEVLNARDAHGGLQIVPLHEAAVGAPFGVFVPASVPGDWRMRVHVIEHNEHYGWPAGVSIHYADEMARVNVNVNEHAAAGEALPPCAPDGDDWRIEQLPVGELRLWEPSEPERGMPRIGLIEIGGTRVQISSGDLGLEAIAELAANLVPAPTEPPAVA
jgi:outer membrane lipoprotein-sorting protein